MLWTDERVSAKYASSVTPRLRSAAWSWAVLMTASLLNGTLRRLGVTGCDPGWTPGCAGLGPDVTDVTGVTFSDNAAGGGGVTTGAGAGAPLAALAFCCAINI